MKYSDKCIAVTKHYEGLRLKVYADSGGIATQGYGHTKGLSPTSPPITIEQANAWLIEDLGEACRGVLKSVKVGLTQGQLDALTDFVFNEGITNFANSTLLKRINAEAFEQCAPEFRKWVYGRVSGKMQVLPGLVERREAEIVLFNEP